MLVFWIVSSCKALRKGTQNVHVAIMLWAELRMMECISHRGYLLQVRQYADGEDRHFDHKQIVFGIR
jgi:hypothetical protein